MQTQTKAKVVQLAGLLFLPLLALTLIAQQTNSLSIEGHSGEAQVVQMQGRNYVDVEGLARILNGSIRFNGSHIVLAIAGSGGGPDQMAAPASGLSKGFLNASIEAMSLTREWHAALKNGMERGYPLSEDWLGPFRRQAQQALASAKVAATTDADKNAFPVFANVFSNMAQLSDKYLQMAKNMNYFAPNALDSDPLDQKLMTCGHTLVNILSSGQFIDDAACR